MTRGEGRRAQDRGAFGTVSQLPSGRWRAMYYGPEGRAGRRYKAPTTFTTKKVARQWLSTVQADIIRNRWLPPEDQAPAPRAKVLTLRAYADEWLPKRKVRGKPLKPRTHEHYRALLDHQILPTLGDKPIGAITREDVENWYDEELDEDTPTLRAHAYSLLKTILGCAVDVGKADTNPCVIRGGASTERVIKIRPATTTELTKLADAIRPERYRAMILLAGWCGLRFGELSALRRRDIDVEGNEGVIRVESGIVRIKGRFVEDIPKSVAGSRDVAIPPHLLPALRAHLVDHVKPGGDALLFPAAGGGYLAAGTLRRPFYKARAAAGRDDLRFHDLRHTGAVLAASTGATLAELMGRIGHSTPAAALRYQHAAEGADKRIAKALSKLANTP